MGSCFPSKEKSKPHHKEPLISARTTYYAKDDKNVSHQIQPIVPESPTSASLGPDIITPNNNNDTPQTQNNPITDNNDTENEEDEESKISDDIILNDTMTSLTMEQHNQLKEDGYCMLDDPLKQQESHSLVVYGYVRENYHATQMEKYLIREIVYFYASRFNTEIFIELVCDKPSPHYFLVPRRNLKLSGVLMTEMSNNEINKIDMNKEKVSVNTLQYVLKYLGHHKGKPSDPLPCPVRSIHMKQIVTDPWDAPFIDPLTKKVLFEIIMTSNYLSITGLTHLACAKIATLIKQLDQKEINRIIEEEEKYRREHAQGNNNDNNDDNDGDDEKKQNMSETKKNDDEEDGNNDNDDDDDYDDDHDNDDGDDNQDEEKEDLLETNGNDDDDDDEDENDDNAPDVIQDEVLDDVNQKSEDEIVNENNNAEIGGE